MHWNIDGVNALMAVTLIGSFPFGVFNRMLWASDSSTNNDSFSHCNQSSSWHRQLIYQPDYHNQCCQACSDRIIGMYKGLTWSLDECKCIAALNWLTESLISASARISKGQGYPGFLRKRAGSSFGQKRALCIVQGKTDRISLLLGSIKCCPLSFNTFKTP
jgi:hypothetical protein